MLETIRRLPQTVVISIGLVLSIVGYGLAYTPLAVAAEAENKPGSVALCAKDQASTAEKPCYCTPTQDGTKDKPCITCDSKKVDCSGLITKYVNPLVRLLSALVGIIVVISGIVAGIQYASSRDESAKVTAAKKRIYNTVLSLLAYLFLLAFLQWLLPGGLI